MQINEAGLELIKSFEGFYARAYRDPVGVITIGYGTTNSDSSIIGKTIKPGMVISKKTAEQWLNKCLEKKYCPEVEKYQNIYHFNENQFSALVSFAYNIGSIDKLTDYGNRSIATIKKKILEYNKAGGKVLNGLTRRRHAELELFNTPVKKKYQGKIPSLPLRGYYKKYDGMINLVSKQAQIVLIQKALNWDLKDVKGYKKLVEDGKYGDATVEAVKKFQKRYKFKDVNGKWGKLCNAQLKKIEK